MGVAGAGVDRENPLQRLHGLGRLAQLPKLQVDPLQQGRNRLGIVVGQCVEVIARSRKVALLHGSLCRHD